MKRFFSTLLLSLLVSTTAVSQIQNKFFGATLGESDINTTYSCMYDYFEEKPFYPLGILSVQNKVYAGYKWDAINAHFHNGKFAQLNLRYHGNMNAGSQNIIHIYNRLKNDLTTKYGESPTIIPDEYGNVGLYYYDGRYAVELIMNWHINEKNEKEYYEVGLWYSDVKLINEPKINNDL